MSAKNYARNSSFESDLAGTWEAGGPGTLDRSQAGPAIEGSWFARLVATGAGNPNIETHPDAYIPAVEGEEWTVSVYLKWGAGTPKPVHVDLLWRDENGATITPASIGGQVTPSDSSWLRIPNNDNAANPGATQFSIRAVVVGAEDGDVLQVEAVMAEKGNVDPPSPWTPGPDEPVPVPAIEPEFGLPTAVDCSVAELRGLLIGEGPLKLVGFNPFSASVRAANEEPLSQADGSYSGREYADVKQVPVRIYADGLKGDHASLFELQQAILAAFAPSHVDLPLRFVYGGRVLRLMGRPRVVELDADRLMRGRLMVECGFVALDPRIYDDDETKVTLLLPSDSGGITLPLTLPVAIDATVETGRAIVTNQGTADTPWRGVIHGPATNPRLVNFTTGEELRIGVSVEDGRYLDLDSATRSVLLDGTASRRGTVSGQWWQLVPGDNDIGWFSDIGSDTALLEVIYRDAWR